MISDGEDCNWYDEEDDDLGYDENDDDSISEMDEDYLPETVELPSEQYYTVLKESEIKKRQNDDITRVSSVLSVPNYAATILLCSFQWIVSDVLDKWFADEDQVRNSVGLVAKEDENLNLQQKQRQNQKLTCDVCFCVSRGRHRYENFISAGCDHFYCKNCYSNYIRVSIDDGIGCLLLRCPEPSCRIVVNQDLINSLKELPDESKSKYEKFLLRSYVEESKKFKWCPAPGCSNAVEFSAETNQKNWDAFCDCLHGFCWNCREEAHSPVECSRVSEWEMKNINESENVNWILAYTKPCPKCRKPIEKNHGCEHMTCRVPCRHEFCWLCLGDWKNHSRSTCNAFRDANTKDDKERKMAKLMIDRYAHYFERWNSNQRSRIIAQADLEKFRTVHRDILLDNYKKQTVNGIEEAWVQIIECRRVLRWSYVYGYYLPENEKGKKNLFEYMQGQAEFALGRLHECAEQEIKSFIGENALELDEFNKYYSKLVNLTRVSRNFFQNLVSGLQNGLELDVVDSSLNRKRKDGDRS